VSPKGRTKRRAHRAGPEIEFGPSDAGGRVFGSDIKATNQRRVPVSRDFVRRRRHVSCDVAESFPVLALTYYLAPRLADAITHRSCMCLSVCLMHTRNDTPGAAPVSLTRDVAGERVHGSGPPRPGQGDM